MLARGTIKCARQNGQIDHGSDWPGLVRAAGCGRRGGGQQVGDGLGYGVDDGGVVARVPLAIANVPVNGVGALGAAALGMYVGHVAGS